MKGIESDTISKEDYYLPGNGFTKQENHETSILPIYKATIQLLCYYNAIMLLLN